MSHLGHGSAFQYLKEDQRVITYFIIISNTVCENWLTFDFAIV